MFMRFYKAENNSKGVNVFVSRSHPWIHQTYHGTRNFWSIWWNCRNHERVSEAGDRTKVAARSHNPNVDAIGTIVIVVATSRKLPAASTNTFDAKTGIKVPRKYWRYSMGWRSSQFASKQCYCTEVDYVLFDEDDSKRATVVVPDNKFYLCNWSSWTNVRLRSFDWLPWHQVSRIWSTRSWKSWGRYWGSCWRD